MDCSHDLPQLVVVPVDSLILHEYHDEQRTPPLIENLNNTWYWMGLTGCLPSERWAAPIYLSRLLTPMILPWN